VLPLSKPQSFTFVAPGRLRSIITPAMICAAVDLSTVTSPSSLPYVAFQAIWDTGATATVITQKVVDACGLKPISLAEVHTVNGKAMCEVYLVSIMIPNGVGFSSIRVAKGTIAEGVDVLIGMDIITLGDLAITNLGGKTMVSFRCPPCEHIRFDSPSVPTHVPKVGRNDPCPCGSGKKYKRCHGGIDAPHQF